VQQNSRSQSKAEAEAEQAVADAAQTLLQDHFRLQLASDHPAGTLRVKSNSVLNFVRSS
jgi:hypothetical protein